MNMKLAANLLLTVCIGLLIFSNNAYSQKGRAVVCSQTAFVAMLPLPEFDYEPPENAQSESDDIILNSPERQAARNETIKSLKNFTDPRWWNRAVSELNPCYLHGKPGKLSAEETEEYTGVEYQPPVMGNSEIRLVLISDPHYQTYYNGANAYLLIRKQGKVYVTEAINGYFSRLAHSVWLKTYLRNRQQEIEIKTANIWAMEPDYYSYYFSIDKRTNKAIPIKQR